VNAFSWSRDGRFMAACGSDTGRQPGIVLLSAQGEVVRRLTQAQKPIMDCMPEFSPDGRSLAHASCTVETGTDLCHVQVLDLDGALAPPARRAG